MDLRWHCSRLKCQVPVWILILLVLSPVDCLGAAGSNSPCASSPCHQNGTCHDFGTAFVCSCPFGYHGLRCETHETEIDQSACDSSPCVQGECSSTGSGSFTCLCPFGWAGTVCERDINECERDTHECNDVEICLNSEGGYHCREICDDSWCSNGGTCVITEDKREGFECLCQPNYAGNTCEILLEDPCEVNQCMNGGVCDMIDLTPKCYCSEGYTGNFCGTKEDASPPSDIEGSCDNHLCQNEAECIPSNINTRGYTCTCQTGFTGALCQVELYTVCIYGGVTYQDDMKRTEECNECYCKKGSWLCTKKHCGSILGTFQFLNPYSSIEGYEESFLRVLKKDLTKVFSVPSDMIDDLAVSPGSIFVTFVLKPLLDSTLDVQVVASLMSQMLTTGNFTFTFDDQSFIVNTSSVAFYPHTEGTTAPIGPNKANISLLIILVIISVIFFIIVSLAVAGILSSNRRKAKKKAKGYNLTTEEIQNLNNSNVVTINNRLYNLQTEEIHTNGTLPSHLPNRQEESHLAADPQSHIYEVVDESRPEYDSEADDIHDETEHLFEQVQEEDEIIVPNEDETSEGSGTLLTGTTHQYEDSIHHDSACCTMERDILRENYYVKLEKPDEED